MTKMKGGPHLSKSKDSLVILSQSKALTRDELHIIEDNDYNYILANWYLF